ncbi:peptidase, M48 domain protein [Leptospira inadai serovar Lyme str. 10]|uniref:Peptidase, M48 domain protein n=2 Tax=Leptospira inadai serovar Lyme TaxID=293084 RepID=V6H8E4_9LEPT|nr:M48 family metallopeptidase [Leptospira inadai]EQA34977.1 peptidase, M48 domain protein [Leptospira inadai serovar Lyme str. 10]PNV75964.1 peptidase [Leptospira inadai serovar Lyme]
MRLSNEETSILKSSKFLLFALFYFSAAFSAAAQEREISFDSELYAQLVRQSNVQFSNLIKSKTVLPDYKDWKKSIDSAFARLSQNSGNPPFPIIYKIVKDSSFNAFAMAGGQFCIHSGALDSLDQIISQREANAASNLDFHRERYIAGVLSHELSHFYNKHVLNSVKKFYALKNEEAGKAFLENTKFSQEQELDADQTGLFLLDRAGYGGEYMLVTLQALNEVEQSYKDSLAASKADKTRTELVGSYYFSSHPSPNERLSRLNTDKKDLYSFLATMERTFDDIQLGKNLDQSRISLEEAIKRYPENIYLSKALAICLHKIWMATVSTEELKVKPVIDMPSFRDSMIFPQEKKQRSVFRTVPGNEAAYNKALEYYKSIIIQVDDPYFLSNYAVLLSYSADDKDLDVAVNIATKAFQSEGTVPLANNLGVVLFWTNRKEEARELFNRLAISIDQKINNLLAQSSKNPQVAEYLKTIVNSTAQKQRVDPDYIYENFTPILNIALMESYASQDAKSKNLASYYLNNYDSTSGWAKVLAKIQSIELPPQTKDSKMTLKVGGVGPGDKLEDLLKNWGKPKRIQTDKSSGMEYFIYDTKDTAFVLDMGQVVQVKVLGQSSPGLGNGVTVGATKPTVEKFLGSKYKKQGEFHDYYENGDTFVKYNKKGKIEVLIIQ